MLPVPTVDAGFQRMFRMRTDERHWLRLSVPDVLVDWWQVADSYSTSNDGDDATRRTRVYLLTKL
jgi:hypothetical protein